MQILVTDVDGTLLDNQGHIPAANLCALRQWVDQGMTIVLATGRNFAAVQSIAQKINRNMYLVLQDGGLVMHYPTLHKLAWHNLSQSDAQFAHNIFQKNKQPLMIFDPLPHGQCFTLCNYGPHAPGLKRYLAAKTNQFRLYSNGLPFPDAPSKLVTIDNQAAVNRLYRILESSLPETRIIKTEAARIKAWFLEVGSHKASKVQGVKTLLNCLNRAFDDVIAVGDAENDIEMLAAAGLGAAMANASERVKAAADVVIGSNVEAGLAQFLEM